ncbi:MAG TPA: phospho-N-acetylmuramoyl-pentapeptide-transferase [Gemmatimonadaceae bacterium]|nr:phospho-N-acetylmuramoyl-pentapeptide-transferase [Gemmatimonadaceae bacterium]
MLNYLLVPFQDLPHFGWMRLFQYITFRSAGAAVTALLITFLVGPVIITRLKRMRLHQVIREGTPDAHQQKGRTPTMGGLIIIGATLISTLLWARLDNKYVLLAMVSMLWMGAIGFLDDYLKLKQKLAGRKNTGLVEGYKLAGQVTLGFALGYYLWKFPVSALPGASTTLPFYKYILIVPLTAGLGWLYVLFVTFVMTGASNAVNVTDGIDGLAAGLTAIAALTFAFYAYVVGRVDASEYLHVYYLRGSGELTVFCVALMGACIGFLWYNTHPAEVFMGDTGSLALGGALAVVSVLLKSEFLLLLVGAVFVAEMISVILQRFVFKYRKRRYGIEYAREHRVFKRAPLHHHFEVKGWDEAQVVVRFWILGVLAAFIALSTLKLR